eukprot:TRINITY_DN2240_c1_g1_i1.p1 TRINITY_DN2240_c1_g1~~TRINITY_DN2240_c1_g1_i1.p1  ORF type:complete len:698 (+),score=367.81 TRINITY_DN2240_c1_g1_i1:93-2186(+)
MLSLKFKRLAFSTNFNRKFSSFSNESPLFEKILIANRGEIACRVMRTAKKLGIKTVAVFSDADRNAAHVASADEAFRIGEAEATKSYLRAEKLIEVAKKTGAQAIHPGYGFLSENFKFSNLCQENGIVFIGPPASAISAMGSKSASKEIMTAAKVPCVPGYHGSSQSIPFLLAEADKIGFPILVKADLGGGGKGMRIVFNKSELEEAVLSAKREAASSFADDRILLERYLLHPRHIEVQVFADKHSNCVYLYERDCSVQRRHQKVIEEAPAPGMKWERRRAIGEAAVAAARAVNYVGAGTVEFIVDQDGTFYFMEMNTRLQVEHPITEMITKQDLVEWQIKVAAGHQLPLKQEEIPLVGHAFEARIYAENPRNNFSPGTGKVVRLKQPEADGISVRIDTGIRQGDEVSVYYDPMIAKLIVHDVDRDAALRRLRLALENYSVVGLHTNVEFLLKLASHPAFKAAELETGFIQKYKNDLLLAVENLPNQATVIATTFLLLNENQSLNQINKDKTSPWAKLEGFRTNYDLEKTIELKYPSGGDQKSFPVKITYKNNGYLIEVNNEVFNVSGKLNEDGSLQIYINDHILTATVIPHNDNLYVFYENNTFVIEHPKPNFENNTTGKGTLLSPMPGKVIKVLAEEGQIVEKDAPLLIIEAMKMEHTIRAPHAGKITKFNCAIGEIVGEKKILATIEAENELQK